MNTEKTDYDICSGNYSIAFILWGIFSLVIFFISWVTVLYYNTGLTVGQGFVGLSGFITMFLIIFYMSSSNELAHF